MELVVERGKARCPRCVAVAAYAFIELGPELLRYEVNCTVCGESYREKLGPVLPAAGVLATVDEWRPAVASVPLRERLDEWVGAARTRAAALSASIAASWEALSPRVPGRAVFDPRVADAGRLQP